MTKKILVGLAALNLVASLTLLTLGKMNSVDLSVQVGLTILLFVNFWQWTRQKSSALFASTLSAFCAFALNVFLVFLPLTALISAFRLEFFTTSAPPLAFFWWRQVFPVVLLVFGVSNAILFLVALTKETKQPW